MPLIWNRKTSLLKTGVRKDSSMKKILFSLQSMVQGGVEKELITVLKALDPAQVQVTLLLGYIEDPEIVKEIPQWVKLINLDIDRSWYLGSLGQIAKARLKKGRVPEAAALILKRGLRIGMTHSNQRLDDLPKQNVQYDVTICYHIHAPFMLKYTAEKVKATKKVGWIHNDFRGSGYPVQKLTPVLSSYDQFVAVSESVARGFKELCPQFAARTSVIHNILDEKEIWEKSKAIPADDPYFSDSRLKILTIGRFSEQKGIDQAIE